MRVRFWGVRGSLPVPGAHTERYGGNTSCVEITSAAGTRIIIDGGTGIRRLGKELMRAEFESGRGQAHILVSHTHWDHIQGLPFFAPFYREGNRLFVYARQRDDQNLRSVFASQADAPFFPVSFDRTRASVAFRELHDGAKFEIEDVRVATTRLNHPFVATAYAVVADGARVAYIADTAPFSDILFGQEFMSGPPSAKSRLGKTDKAKLGSMAAAVVRLCANADLVIYDTMYTADEYKQFPHFGHSRPSDALTVCREAGAKTLALFHHAPDRSDAEVDAMLAGARVQAGPLAKKLEILAAFEGLDLALGKA
jgi:phosphoribosyl 1,2-cyclic phosphodiesterase